MRTSDELFDLWWSQYPRRVAKQDARRAWAKLDVDEELLTLMLRALDWQVREWDDVRFIPYPATYLNGRRWEDEPPRPLPKPSLHVCPKCLNAGGRGDSFCDCPAGQRARAEVVG